MIAHALSLARRGIPVFPLNGKVPVTKNGLKDATTDPNLICQLWTRHPGANIGARTGVKFWVLDIDGPEGVESLRGLPTLPDTVEVITGSGGKHLYFNPVTGLGNRAGVRPGIDVRAEAGYVVAPPSTHPNGKLYVWGPACANQIADAPDWLIEMVRAPACKAPFAGAAGMVPEGQRNDAIARVAGRLLRQWGLDRQFVDDLVLAFNAARCTPPLPEEEVRRTVESIARKEAVRRAALVPASTPAPAPPRP